jgi:D-amino-acid dehydrogenase
MHVLVIGGGVIGLTTAYQLVRAGAEVTVLDARAAGRGASEVNAGWIVPAESAPVPGPGVAANALKWMLRRDSPLYIRPSLSPYFWSFMIGMWRAANAKAQRAGFEAHLTLAAGTIEMFDDYRADGMEFELQTNGLLMAFTRPENFQHHLHNLDLVKRFGLEPTVLRGDAVRAQEPLLSDAVIGGLYFPKERHVDPAQLVRALRQRLGDLGANLVENAPVTKVHRSGNRVTALAAGAQKYSADAYLLAAGAWSGPLARQFGVRLPIRPGKGYCVDLEPFPLRTATNLSDAKVAVTPFSRKLRLAGTMEFGGLDEAINKVRVAAICRAPQTYFRNWEPPERPAQPRAGMRPMTPDGLPVMGQLGGLDNVYVSSGHGMLGVTLGPGSAAAMTEMILRGTCPATLAPFTPRRLGQKR